MAWRDEFLPPTPREFFHALVAPTLFGPLMGGAFVARAFEPESIALRDALLAAARGL